MPRILLINGPNLNLLGTREPQLYGSQTLEQVTQQASAHAQTLGLELECVQSNHEGELVTRIQQARDYDGLLINAGAYTHTSIAIMDALLTLSIPVVELHMSNIFRREEFRHASYVSKAAHGVICGFGAGSYTLALSAIAELTQKSETRSQKPD